MNLNADQLSAIQNYCRKYAKSYFDIEQELADHMINYIETAMKNSASFATAFATMKQEFPAAAIKGIIDSKTSLIKARLFRKTKASFMAFFTVPKIGITLLLLILFIWLDQKNDKEKIVQALIHFLNLINISYAFGKGKEANRNIREKKKSILSMSILYSIHIIMTLPAIYYLAISLAFLNGFVFSTTLVQISFYAFPIVVLGSIAWQHTYIENQLLIRKQYPGAFAN